MNTKKIYSFFITSMLLIGSLSLQQCTEDDAGEQITEQEESTVAQGAAEADATVDDELQFISTVDLEGNPTSGGRAQSQCVTITRDDAQKLVTLNFGQGCVGPYGRTRSGKVLIVYGGEFDDDLANRVITFDDYKVNNKSITGTIELRNLNMDDDGLLTATRKLVNLVITYPNGQSTTLNGEATREWIEGFGDEILDNDVIRLTGSLQGVSTNGKSFSHVIKEPVISSFGCRKQGGFLRTAGVVEQVVSNKRNSRTRTLNYGNGTCDNLVTMIINGNEVTITVNN